MSVQEPGSLDLSKKTFLTSHFPLRWLTVSYLFLVAFCPYRPCPSVDCGWVYFPETLFWSLLVPKLPCFKTEILWPAGLTDSSLCQSVWDRLGPGTLCCKACTRPHPSLELQDTKKLYGTRNHLCACAVGANSGPKDTKGKKHKNSQLPFLKEPGAKILGVWPQSRVLHISTTKGWTNHLSHPCSSTSGLTPALTHILRNKLTTALGNEQREPNCLLFSLFPAKAGLIKHCLNFLSGLQSVSIYWRNQRTGAYHVDPTCHHPWFANFSPYRIFLTFFHVLALRYYSSFFSSFIFLYEDGAFPDCLGFIRTTILTLFMNLYYLSLFRLYVFHLIILFCAKSL